MFTEFDVIVCVIVLISTIMSFMKGFIKDFLGIIAWIGAAIVTLFFFPYAASLMEELFRSSWMVNVAAVIVVYVSALSLISLINKMVLDNMREFSGGAADRSLGMAFGLIKGVVIISILHFSIIEIAEEEPVWLSDGETHGLTKSGSDIILGFSDEAADRGKEKIEERQEIPFID